MLKADVLGQKAQISQASCIQWYNKTTVRLRMNAQEVAEHFGIVEVSMSLMVVALTCAFCLSRIAWKAVNFLIGFRRGQITHLQREVSM